MLLGIYRPIVGGRIRITLGGPCNVVIFRMVCNEEDCNRMSLFYCSYCRYSVGTYSPCPLKGLTSHGTVASDRDVRVTKTKRNGGGNNMCAAAYYPAVELLSPPW